MQRSWENKQVLDMAAIAAVRKAHDRFLQPVVVRSEAAPAVHVQEDGLL